MNKSIFKMKSNPTGSSACKIPVCLFPEEKYLQWSVCPPPAREHLSLARQGEETNTYLSSA